MKYGEWQNGGTTAAILSRVEHIKYLYVAIWKRGSGIKQITRQNGCKRQQVNAKRKKKQETKKKEREKINLQI